jgi:hypothetical protein
VIVGDGVARVRRAAGGALRAGEVRDLQSDEERVARLEVAVRENAAHLRRLELVVAGLESAVADIIEKSIHEKEQQ